MLVRNGAVLCSELAAVHCRVRESVASGIIKKAVMHTRQLFEKNTPNCEEVALRGIQDERGLAFKVYGTG